MEERHDEQECVPLTRLSIQPVTRCCRHPILLCILGGPPMAPHGLVVFPSVMRTCFASLPPNSTLSPHAPSSGQAKTYSMPQIAQDDSQIPWLLMQPRLSGQPPYIPHMPAQQPHSCLGMPVILLQAHIPSSGRWDLAPSYGLSEEQGERNGPRALACCTGDRRLASLKVKPILVRVHLWGEATAGFRQLC